MTFEENLKLYCSPEAVEEPGMVYEVWSDGEITLTKSGDLYGKRNLHCILPAAIPEWVGKADADLWPKKAGNGFGFMPVKNYDCAVAVRNLIKESFENMEKIRNNA